MTGKTLNRRDFLRVSALTAAGAALAGCATPTPEQVQVEVTREVVEQATVVVQATAPPPGVQHVVIFVGFGTGTAANQIAEHDAMAQEFNDTHEDVQIEFLTVPWGEHTAKYSTMLAANMAPDIALPIGVGGIAEFMGGWLDLSPYITADQYDMSDFFGPTVEIHTYPDQGVVGLPLCVYPSVIYYNEDLFDAAGLDYPPHKYGEKYADGSAWTYDKLVELARQLTLDSAGNNADSPAFSWEDSTQWGWNGWDWSQLNCYVPHFGGNPRGVSEDNKTAEFTAKEWVDTLQFDADVTWQDHARATSEQAGAFYDVAGDPMGSGMVGMWEIHSWMGYAYDSWTEAFNWDVGIVPAVPPNPQVSPVDADTFVMPKSGAHADAAWQVIKWFFEPTQFDRLCKNYTCLPARQSVATAWVEDMSTKYPGVGFQVFLESLSSIDHPNHESWVPNYKKITDAITTAWDQVRTGQNLNVAEVLDTLNTQAQGFIDEWWQVYG
jgi:multiple sugar transport system substrate-binding protein